ncbi:MAG: SDR family oxidoreductase [Dehalococcoidia bacterium]|nr:SDR family oxidoreductase [Dehalococcoidia bacterium]
MDLGIKGRVAMVTGGSRGLGRQIALTLAREGCNVAICARTADALQPVVAEIRKHGGNAVAIPANVMVEADLEKFYDETRRALGPVDILVNNAGGTRGGREFDTTTDQDWNDTLNINLSSAIRLTRLVLPGMRERRWGRVVSIASIFGREYGGALSYMTAKAALIAFSKHMALTYAQDNVLFNTVSPGSIQFPGGSWDRFVNTSSPEIVQEFVARNLPMGKFGWPEPIGEMVAFLCSDRADLVAGVSINVDGGQSKSLF